MRGIIAVILGLGLVVVVAFLLDSQLLSSSPAAIPATIEAIEGFLPADPESRESVTYVLRLADGSHARMTSPLRHAPGTRLIVMVSQGRLSGRKLVSSTYVVSSK
jgi:hypothetical protein